MGRKKYTEDFKKKVGEAAAKGDKTLKLLSEEFGVHTTLVSNWKKDYLSGKFEDQGNGNGEVIEEQLNESDEQEEKVKSLMKNLISLGEGWNEYERWTYGDDNFIMYELTSFDDIDVLAEEIEELVAYGILEEEEEEYDYTKFNVNGSWKGEWTLHLDCGSIHYVSFNIAEGDNVPDELISYIENDCNDEDLLVEWLENAIENEWTPDGD
jgi:transposase-like protein